MTTSTNTAQRRYLNTMQLSNHLGISTQTLQQWPRYANWPADARHRSGRDVMWDVEKVSEFLRNRPLGKRGTRPVWLKVVGHREA
jgi:hypothetical protein